MEHEKVVEKLRGVKSILYHISEINGNIEDRPYALMLLAEEIDSCIEELESN